VPSRPDQTPLPTDGFQTCHRALLLDESRPQVILSGVVTWTAPLWLTLADPNGLVPSVKQIFG